MSNDAPGADGARVPRTISELIQRHKRLYDESYGRIARRSVRGEGPRPVSTASVNNFALGKVKEIPPLATIRGLAHALNLPEVTIVLGFAAEIGIDVAGARFAERLPPNVDTLPEHQLDALTNLIRAMLRSDDQLTVTDANTALPSVSDSDVLSGRVKPGRQRDDPDADTQSTTSS